MRTYPGSIHHTNMIVKSILIVLLLQDASEISSIRSGPTDFRSRGKSLTDGRQDDSEDDFVVEDSEESEDSMSESDLEDLSPSATANWIPQGVPPCKYGLKCVRNNPSHFDSCSHPPLHAHFKAKAAASSTASESQDQGGVSTRTGAGAGAGGAGGAGGADAGGSISWIPSGVIKCKYGLDCKRMNPNHFLQESHPSSHPRAAHAPVSSPSEEYLPKDKPRCQ